MKRLEEGTGGFSFETNAQGTHARIIEGRGNLNLFIFASQIGGHQGEGGKADKLGAKSYYSNIVVPQEYFWTVDRAEMT